MPVDWESIKSEAQNNPQHIKDLVARLAADQLDTTLTWQERILAFYGQSYLTKDREELETRKLRDLLKKGQLDECLAAAKHALETNPLNIDALRAAGSALQNMSQDPTKWPDVTEKDASIYFKRTFRIYNTIAMTGDGSAKYPFAVTKISDEYNFMRNYLELNGFAGQQLLAVDNVMCDKFKLNATSQYYGQDEIYFDVTRVLEIEAAMFQ